jgi:PAS domain S-box-containing protein
MAANRDFYGRLLDGISDGVYFMDRDRIIRYWNRGAERITGFNKEEVIGTACRDNVLMHVDDAGTSLCLAELCPALGTIMDGQEREAEVYLHHKEGYRLPVIARISPIRDDSGNITGAHRTTHISASEPIVVENRVCQNGIVRAERTLQTH